MQNVDDLRFYLFPSEAIGAVPYRRFYAQAYLAWRRTWEDELHRLDPATEMVSDPFTRADVVGVIAAGGTVGGVMLCKLHDLELPAYRDQSSLKQLFTGEFIDDLQRDGNRILLTFEQLTVVPEWRKLFTGIQFGHALVALGLEIFPYTGADCVAVSTRNTRKVNKMVAQLGFKTKAVKAVHGEESDMMVFNAKTRQRFPDERLEDLLSTLWRNRMDYANWTDSPGVTHVA